MATNFESFNEDEIEAADSLIVLALYQTKKEALNSRFRFRRWGSKRRRSIPKDSKIQDDDEEEEEAKKVLSPSTPLSFSPSGGETPPPTRARKVFKKMEQHRAWVKEQNQRIAALSATKLTLQHGVLEAKRRYHMLRETNSWLRELRSKWRGTLVAQRGGGVGVGGFGGRIADWCLPWVGPAMNQRMDSNRSLDEEEWRRRWAAYAAARKRRMLLQRVKSASVRIQRLR